MHAWLHAIGTSACRPCEGHGRAMMLPPTCRRTLGLWHNHVRLRLLLGWHAPMVDAICSSNASCVNRVSKLVLPTPLSPSTRICNTEGRHADVRAVAFAVVVWRYKLSGFGSKSPLTRHQSHHCSRDAYARPAHLEGVINSCVIAWPVHRHAL